MTGSPYQQEQQAVIDATLNLFGASMTESLMIPYPTPGRKYGLSPAS